MLVLSLYTAVRYKDDMSVFDHYTDGMLLKTKRKSLAGADDTLTNADEEEMDLAEVSVLSDLWHFDLQ